ncbi:MAG TPA: acylneuraminate cytidylyltransferase family protein [Solirubrobacteraceae bacterium]|nr:acylneuraminate cytidylyltransferase family protein [Solirubrobacteraceae bacterium]
MTTVPSSDAWDSATSLCLIPARGGSVSVPGKNLRPLGGMPLVAHSILSARASGMFDDVYVSTQETAIAEVAVGYGAVAIDRPAALAQADTPMAPVVEHALEWCRRERAMPARYIFLLQPTSPLRTADDIRLAASLLTQGRCDSVMGVFEADDPPQWSLTAASDGLLRPVAGWEQYLSRRQDLRPTYLDGPLHAIRTDAFHTYKRFLTDSTRFFVVPRERAIDIDTEFDFRLAEFLLEHCHAIDARVPAPS